MKLKIMSLVVLTVILAACGKKAKEESSAAPAPVAPKGSGGAPAGGDKPTDGGNTNPGKEEKLSCEDAWKKYVEYNGKDEFFANKTTTESVVNGTSYPSTSETKMTVVTSEDSHVEWKNEATVAGQVYSSQVVFAKEIYINTCKNQTAVDAERGEEEITVAAGTYKTSWTKVKLESGDTKTVTQTWTTKLESGDTLVVKTEMNQENSTGTMKSVTELVDTNKN